MIKAKCCEWMGGYEDGKVDSKLSGYPLCGRRPYWEGREDAEIPFLCFQGVLGGLRGEIAAGGVGIQPRRIQHLN